MELFLSANIHQGSDLFSVYSRGRQCAFMCLSALLTARNNPVVVWSKTTLNNVLLQEDSMYLEALNSGLIVLNSGVHLLSINNLPSVVYVTCYTGITDNFSYELCQSAMDTFVYPINDKKPTEAKTIIDPPIVVEPTEAQTITDLLIEAQNNSDLPIVVGPIEAQTIIDPPIVVGPIEAQVISNTISCLPVEEENESQIWLINYGKELQGRAISDREHVAPQLF